MTPALSSHRGFTLIEALAATTIMVIVTAGIFRVVNPSAGVFGMQPEVADLQQRLRVAVSQLRHDLLNAGAGSYSGLNDTTTHQTARSLANYFAPLLPYVQSSGSNDDGQGKFFSTRITIIYVPSTAAQTSLKTDMTSPDSRIQVNQESGCPFTPGTTEVADPLCGFHAAAAGADDATQAVIYDGSGAFDEFVVTAVDESGGHLDFQHLQQGTFSQSYKVPSRISEVKSRSYFLKTDTNQLMQDDGLGTTVPVLDNVAGLSFEYYGDPLPPIFVASGPGDLSTTYGPAPPGLDAATPIAGWPPGENCVWAIHETTRGRAYASRLLAMGDEDGALVPLPAATLTDGPWCPNASNSNRYDADLLRIRKIRVTVRVQTGNRALRGSGSLAIGPDALFVNGGTARSLSNTVFDQAIRFDVSPRNLNLGR
jgi:type II secretory pathway pseudopilin PulG